MDLRPLLNKEGKLELSYSKITNWQRCRMRWFYTYRHNLTARGKTQPLMTGDVVHRLREDYLNGEFGPEEMKNLVAYVTEIYPDEDPGLIAAVAIESGTLINSYIQRYDTDSVQIISPEVHLEKDFGKFILYTRIDGLATVEGTSGLWREELKTTSRTDSAYLGGLRKGLQTGIAIWLMEELFFEDKIMGTVFTQIVKKKFPETKSQPHRTVRHTVEMAKEVVQNEAEEMLEGKIWRSGDCFQWNRECSFMMLCKGDDTEKNREMFYQPYKTLEEA